MPSVGIFGCDVSSELNQCFKKNNGKVFEDVCFVIRSVQIQIAV